jgi:hypothetical protein
MLSKNRTNKRKSRKSLKTRRRKQKGGVIGLCKPPITLSDGPILPEDILFQDADVCILKPHIKKGVLIFTHYNQPAGMPSLCEEGLKTGRQLQSEGVNFGRSMIHNYIFFRAPYFSNPIDYRSIKTEIASLYENLDSETPSKVWIRIDPEKTNVYSSEIRATFSPQIRYGTPEYLFAIESEVRKSKKSMTKYFQILHENEKVIREIEPGKKPLYNLLTSKVEIFPNSYNLPYPFNSHKINENSEVLVRVPHLTKNYFVTCTT